MTRPALRVAVDLHCHILPGLDDGARDLEDAVGMARQAQADGIGAICATPHIRHDHDVRIDELPERLTELAGALRAVGCPASVLSGGEVAGSAVEKLDDRELAGVSLGGSGTWILLEPEPGPLDDRLDRSADALQGRGFQVVIAHPERHLGPDLMARLERLVLRGGLVQATAASLVDEPTRQGMLALAAAGLIHVLGSDSHSSRVGRPVTLAPALSVLGAVEPPAAHLDWIARSAPLAIVQGRRVSAPFAPQSQPGHRTSPA